MSARAAAPLRVTLAALRPRWRVCASDLSPDALAVARSNAARHGAAARMTFVQGDLLGPFAQPRPGADDAAAGSAAGLRIDVLVSNPPYIPAGDIPGLQPEVRDYEPRLALDGGDDGLTPYRRMLEQLPLLEQCRVSWLRARYRPSQTQWLICCVGMAHGDYPRDPGIRELNGHCAGCPKLAKRVQQPKNRYPASKRSVFVRLSSY